MNELEFKLGLSNAIQEYIDSIAEDGTWEDLKIGSVPYNLKIYMAEAAFSVLVAVKGTNEYRDENME